jgi:hypothetical protein
MKILLYIFLLNRYVIHKKLLQSVQPSCHLPPFVGVFGLSRHLESRFMS